MTGRLRGVQRVSKSLDTVIHLKTIHSRSYISVTAYKIVRVAHLQSEVCTKYFFQARIFSREMLRNFPENFEPLFCGSEKIPQNSRQVPAKKFPPENQKRIANELLQERREKKLFWNWIPVCNVSQTERNPSLGPRSHYNILAHRNRSDFCDLRLRCPTWTPEIARFQRQEKAMLHCDLSVRWKVASDLRFRAAISEPKTPSFCGISGDLAQSTQKSLAIAIVRFWCAKHYI